MKNLTRMFIKPTQTVLLTALVGMLSLCTACTKQSQTERVFYGRGNTVGGAIGFFVGRSANAIANAVEFVNDYDAISSGVNHDYLT